MSVDWEFSIDYLIAALVSLLTGPRFLVPIVGQSLVTKDLEGEWMVRLRFGSVILFEQHVKLTVRMIALTNVAFGALTLGLFTWWHLKEEITTTVVDGQPTGENNPAWRYTIGGTEFSEFGTMERGGGSDYTDVGGIVEDWWMSPVYMMDVPVGAEWDIEFARAQGGVTRRNLLFQFRFGKSAPLTAYLDRHGALRLFKPQGKRLHALHTYHALGDARHRDFINNASDAIIWKDRTNRMYALALQDRRWLLWYSDLEGIEWLPALYTRHTMTPDQDESEEGTQVAFWRDGFRNIDVIARRQGGFVSVAMLNDRIYFMASADGVRAGDIRPIGEHNGKQFSIHVGSTAEGRERIDVLDGYDYHYRSLDGGYEWERLPA